MIDHGDSSQRISVAPVGLTPIVAEVRALIDTVAASFEDDPGGEGVARLVVTVGLQTTNLLESFTVRLGYEVTAVVPHHKGLPSEAPGPISGLRFMGLGCCHDLASAGV